MTRPITTLVVVLTLFGGAFLLLQYDRSSSAQMGGAAQYSQSYGGNRASYGYGGGGEMGMGMGMGMDVVPFSVRLAREGERLRNAKTEEQRGQAKAALEKLLGDYFDSDMIRRKRELDTVKQRVVKLEALFQKREAAKKEIIDLQVRTTVAESEGLGFFSAPASGAAGGVEVGWAIMGGV